MTPEELLAQLETMTHAGRVQTMIGFGRRSDAESQAIIGGLEHGDFYERFMALYACFGSRDSDHALRALADPSRIIRGLALRLLPLLCDDTQLQQALFTAPAHVYQPLLWKLHQRKQQAAVDAFLERLAAQESAQLCQLLPFGSPALVARFSERFQQQATQGDWTRLARFHPAIALDLLQQWAEATTAQDTRLVQYVNSLMPLLARSDAQRSLDLVKSVRRTTQLSQLRLQPLVQELPSEVADLVLAMSEGGWLSISFNQLVKKLTITQILALEKKNTALIGWYYVWFQHLSPEQRLAVYKAGERRFRHKGALATALVEKLPSPQREQEARRVVALPHWTALNRLDYAGLLPWDEALKHIEPLLHATDAPTRQKALQALIQAVKYQRGHLPDALTILRGYRTEHDPVRRVIVQQLAAIPLSAWREEHLADLAEIIRHGLNDVGLSPETLQAITTLLLKLLPAHTDWCAAQLATVLRERGLPSTGRGQSASPAHLSAEQAQRLLTALLPVLRHWLEQEKETDILTVAQWVARHEQAFDLLQPLLEEIVQRTRSSQTATAALEIISSRRFERLQALIPALLQEDASWITFSFVSNYLLRRQDLLTPFLRFQSYAGRWSTGRKRFLLPLSRRFAGGTTRQQEAYANALMEIISDETQESQPLTQAVKTLPLLPSISAAHLAALSRDERSVVRTTALFALGRLDTTDGLPTLIEALQDARARIAIPALHSYLLKMPPAQALGIIRGIPMNRVTVAKERVRLTGALATEEAYQELLVLERRKLHRDVRIALIRMLTTYLDRSATWPLLEQAAQSANAETALAALPRGISPAQLQQPVKGETETVEQHLLRLLLLLLNHAEYDVRLGTLYHYPLAIRDGQRVLMPRLLELLSAPVPAESEAAARAIFNLATEGDTSLIAQALRGLLSNRRVVLKLVNAYQSPSDPARQRLLPIVESMLHVLAEDRLTASLRVRLAFLYLPMEHLIAFFQSLSQRDEWHAEALVEVCRQIEGQSRFELEQWKAFEAAFATSADERLRRLAFAALKAQTMKLGHWDEERLARLKTYRADPSALVAAAAEFTLPDDDDELDDDDDWEDDE
jgi:HEAT repeat protein